LPKGVNEDVAKKLNCLCYLLARKRQRLPNDVPSSCQAGEGIHGVSDGIDDNTHAVFSIKASTNNTGGQWTDKKQEWADALPVALVYTCY